MGLRAKTARVIRKEGAGYPGGGVVAGDLIVVRPGSGFRWTGLSGGNTSIDESHLTGESMPVEKGPGDDVVGASINKFGSFTFQALKVGRIRF